MRQEQIPNAHIIGFGYQYRRGGSSRLTRIMKKVRVYVAQNTVVT